MQHLSFRVVFLSLALAATAFASADVAYTSFGTLGTGYNPFSGRTVSASPLSYSAQQFTSGLTGSLTSIDIAGSRDSGSGSITIELLSDNAGAPGAVLTSATTTFTTLYQVLNSPITGANLTAGTKYWVGLRPNADTSMTWLAKFDFMNLNGPVATNYGGAGSSVDPNGFLSAMRINAAPVPEPATMAALGLGLAAVLRRRWK